MIERSITPLIIKSLKTFPVVSLLGSRQVGKTTQTKHIMGVVRKKAVYLDLELHSDLNKLSEPEIYLRQFADCLIIIDEIQRMPSLFPLIRALVDQKRVSGRFLLLGSASPDLLRHTSESLAGRIIYHELTPFTISEVGFKKGALQNLWVRGGYPESFLPKKGNKSYLWRDSFLKTLLERDIPQLGIRIHSIQLRKFLTMIGHSNAQLLNLSNISKSLGLSGPTIRHYLDIFTNLFFVRQLQPFHINIKKRLVKSPKVYIRDTGLLHLLLGIESYDELLAHPQAGNSWEGLVVEEIISLAPAYWESFFFRTSAGAEIDLLLLDRNKRRIAIEVKHSLSPKVTKGFWNAFKDLSCKKGYVIYPGRETYPLSDNVSVLPATDMVKIFK